MQHVEIYTTPLCGYCHAAKRLLNSKGVDFSEVDVSADPQRRAEMTQRANGGRTVPQIFIGDIHVGGSDELHALERAGKLDALLERGMKTALLQLNVSDDPAANLTVTRDMVREAAGQGAAFVLTPEVTNCISTSRAHQQDVLRHEGDDETLKALRAEAAEAGIWLLIGSLALKTGEADGRFANRSFLITPEGEITARYDKIHMFDVDISETETYRESAGYRPGTRAVLAETPFAPLGMTVCYDVRFPALYQSLAQAGARMLTVPSAFSPVTGGAHWHALLRARAIETGCFVLAPAQCGTHASAANRTRDTYGHSLAVDPWGEVLLDAGTDPGVYMVDLDMEKGEAARRRVPSLANRRDFTGP